MADIHLLKSGDYLNKTIHNQKNSKQITVLFTPKLTQVMLRSRVPLQSNIYANNVSKKRREEIQVFEIK